MQICCENIANTDDKNQLEEYLLKVLRSRHTSEPFKEARNRTEANGRKIVEYCRGCVLMTVQCSTQHSLLYLKESIGELAKLYREALMTVDGSNKLGLKHSRLCLRLFDWECNLCWSELQEG